MYDDQRVVAVVPARGGSKTVPRKNVRTLGKKPLVAWSIDVALETDEIDRVLVSTDNEEIAGVSREHRAEVIERPKELATDDALVIDAIRQVITSLREGGESATYLVMLEPTCPFRESQDVRRCLESLADGRDSVATFTQCDLNPHRAWTVSDDHPKPFLSDGNPWSPRQRLPDAYQLNGGVYAFRIDAFPDTGRSLLFGDTGAVLMPEERSVDIDTELDLAFARMMADRRD
jgi:N-acylneuraminate cytidylyltransferase